MSKRSREKQARRDRAVQSSPEDKATSTPSARTPWLTWGLPLLLAALAFGVYLPSLRSDFVYDGRQEILEEGFITSLSNLPAVLSLKVLAMPLILANRPGTMLYLMLNAALWGKSPWGYHLVSNLLHAANVGLLFVLLNRLVDAEKTLATVRDKAKITFALVLATLIFALHPLTVEPVSAINFSSDLLEAFFTLVALWAATHYRPAAGGSGVAFAAVAVLCCFAAVTCKESGLATPLLLVVYWSLYRRREATGPWLCFLGAALGLTAIYLAARFSFEPPGGRPAEYLGHSFGQVFLIQPRLWVFMLGKVLIPLRLSADYTLEDVGMVSTPLALLALGALLFLQGWLASRSRVGLMGVAMYWLGLATVSNFTPLFRIVGDRFYYVPLAGVSLQLVAVFLLVLHSRMAFGLIAASLLLALLPLAWLNLQRQQVFFDDSTLWQRTEQVSPYSWTAPMILGATFERSNQLEPARVQLERSIQLDAGVPESHNLLGILLTQEGQDANAISECQTAVRLNPQFAEGFNDLGNAYLHAARPDLAIPQYQIALRLNPRMAQAAYNLGNAFFKEGQLDLALVHYQQALTLQPDLADAYANMGTVYLRQGQHDLALAQYQKALDLAPDDLDVRRELNAAQSDKNKQQGLADRLRSLLVPHR